MKNSVSVIIPTYNSSNMVCQAVESVLAQTLPAGEIVVVDDGSVDDTGERLRPYAGAIRYIAQGNAGVSAARNRGLREARGGVVAFLDADDVWHPRKLEMQMVALARHPELGLLGSAFFEWPAKTFPCVDGSPGLARLVPISWPELAVKNRFATSSVVVRRWALDRAGEFDTGLQGPEDRDLWLRVAEVARVANLDLPLMGYRSAVEGSVSKQAARCQAGMLRIMKKLEERGCWRGRPLLRRKAYSYVYHSCSYLLSAEGAYGRAAGNMLRSFAWYPLPYRRAEVRTHIERPKRLAITAGRLLGLMRPDLRSRREGEPTAATSGLEAVPTAAPATAAVHAGRTD